ncbi:MAG: hypothetical protein AAGA03_19635, partial [Planctomycetota bacterium]
MNQQRPAVFAGILSIPLLLSLCVGLQAQEPRDDSTQQGSGSQFDQVWITPSRRSASAVETAPVNWFPDSIRQVSGKIQSLNDQQLQIIVGASASPRTYAADRVLWIRPGSLSPAQQAAWGDFSAGDYRAAAPALIRSVDTSTPVWMQQWISMAAAQATFRLGNGKTTLEIVRQLDRAPLPPLVLAWLPIAWSRHRALPSLADSARSVDPKSGPAAELVAASWLLASDRRAASARLERLANRNDRPRIAALARSVRWQLATPPQVSESSARWNQQLEAMP